MLLVKGSRCVKAMLAMVMLMMVPLFWRFSNRFGMWINIVTGQNCECDEDDASLIGSWRVEALFVMLTTMVSQDGISPIDLGCWSYDNYVVDSDEDENEDEDDDDDEGDCVGDGDRDDVLRVGSWCVTDH